MTVLAVFAHPDDEVLACGATLAKHAAAGDTVHVLVFTDGVGSRYFGWIDQIGSHAGAMRDRADQFRDACRRIGATGAAHDYEDQQLDTIPVKRIADDVRVVIQQHRPSIVYTHQRHDLNRDHRLVAEAVMIATRPQAGCSVKAVYGGEVPSSTEWAFGTPFNPTLFVDVTPFMQDKREALACYTDEVRDWPHPRSLRGVTTLAEYRGQTIGVAAAEAFEIVREIR